MKNVFLIILYFLLIFKGNAQGLSSSTNDYNYTSYSSIYKNENISGTYITSTSARESILYVTSTGITITNANLDKMFGDLADKDIKDSEFYGVNAAVLVNGGEVTITNSLIVTRVKGSNAVCATNSGTVTISGATVTTSGTASSRGLYATYGGTITASGVTISTMWKSCATLSTDRGGGTVSCTGCTLSTMDSGSPFIYSGGTTSIITVSGTTGTHSASQCVVIEGKNTAIVKDRSNLKCTGQGNTGDADNSGIFLYQSMSGDADVGTTTFTCTNSTFEIDSYSSVYDSVPIFSITNTAAAINLEGCTFKYGSGTFLNVTKNSAGWGTSGSNGGNVTLTLTNQDIEGDFIIDSCSSLTIKMINSSIIGAINTWNTSTNVAVILDADSSLNLTGDSYISSYTNEDTTGSNINKESYIFADNYGNDWITTESSTSASTTTVSTITVSTTTVSTITVSTTTVSTTSNNSENPISNYDESLYILLGKTIAIATVAFMLLLLLFLLKNFIKSIFE